MVEQTFKNAQKHDYNRKLKKQFFKANERNIRKPDLIASARCNKKSILTFTRKQHHSIGLKLKNAQLPQDRTTLGNLEIPEAEAFPLKH